MNPTPDHPTTLAQALAALRDDLAAQPPPPPSVLAAAQRAAVQARRAAAREGSPAGPIVFGAPAGAWRLSGRFASGIAGARVASGRSGAPGLPGPWGAWAGAATCAAVLSVSLLLALRPPQMSPAQEAVARPGAASLPPTAQVASVAGDLIPAMHFVPLVSPERMRALFDTPGANGVGTGADTPAWVVTTELPQQRLAAMGLPYDPGHAAERLRAELLVAGSGEVLAVRLLF